LIDERARALAEILPALQQYIELGEAINSALKSNQLPASLPQVAARSVHTALVALAAQEILARAPQTADGVAKRLAGLTAPARAAA